MTILATSKTQRFPGPDLKINCPKCGPNVPGISYRLEERMGLYFIPLLTQRETYVECPKCNTARLTDLAFEELAVCPPDELDRHLVHRISLIIKVLALASLFVFCVPFLGLAFGVIGYLASKKTGGWIKVVSIIGITLGAIGTLGMLAVMFTPKS